MTKEQYIKELEKNLKKLPDSERQEAIRYYSEYIDDALDNNSNDMNKVINDLGSARTLAHKIMADSAIKKFNNHSNDMKPKEKASNTWLIILAVIASPIWSPLVLVLFILLFTALFIALTIAVSGIALFLGGAVVVLMAIASFFLDIATAIYIGGAGLICLGLGILAIILSIFFYELLCKGIRLLAIKIFKKRNGGAE